VPSGRPSDPQNRSSASEVKPTFGSRHDQSLLSTRADIRRAKLTVRNPVWNRRWGERPSSRHRRNTIGEGRFATLSALTQLNCRQRDTGSLAQSDRDAHRRTTRRPVRQGRHAGRSTKNSLWHGARQRLLTGASARSSTQTCDPGPNRRRPVRLREEAGPRPKPSRRIRRDTAHRPSPACQPWCRCRCRSA
jgi:hypothetical protein